MSKNISPVIAMITPSIIELLIENRGLNMEIIHDIDEITKEVVDAVLELLKDKVYKIVLYGSYARGDFTIGSDIDIMILVKSSKEEVSSYNTMISKIASRLSLKNDIDISLIIRDRETYEHRLRILPFYQNVEGEGIALYG